MSQMSLKPPHSIHPDVPADMVEAYLALYADPVTRKHVVGIGSTLQEWDLLGKAYGAKARQKLGLTP